MSLSEELEKFRRQMADDNQPAFAVGVRAAQAQMIFAAAESMVRTLEDNRRELMNNMQALLPAPVPHHAQVPMYQPTPVPEPEHPDEYDRVDEDERYLGLEFPRVMRRGAGA